MGRSAQIVRNTQETQIALSLDLEQKLDGNIDTGSPFLDHMLDLLRKHAGMGLSVLCKGDPEIDMHHSTEDIAICLGQALAQSLGDKNGIERYGFYYVTMDETLTRCCLDLSGRFYLNFNAVIKNSRIGNFDTELTEHFFYSLAENAKMNLHLDLIRGNNSHHIIESLFKAFARALAMAVSPSRQGGIPSTKGILV